MKYLAFLIVSIFYFIQKHSNAHDDKICPPSWCNIALGPPVRFPFQLKNQPSNHPCGYPGLFDLSCNNRNQTILNIASIGDLVVNKIDYISQELFVDPQLCHPGRILSFSLSGSPFTSPFKRYYTFYNCSSALKVEYPKVLLSCLSGENYTVFGIATIDDHGTFVPNITCMRISLVDFPVLQWSVPHEALDENFQLSWDVPDCRACELRGRNCAIKTGTGFGIDCYDHDTKSRSTTSKLGIYLGVGLPCLLLAAFGVAYIRYKKNVDNTRHPNMELSAIVSNPQQSVIHKGLDDATIESYLKTILDEKCQLPEPGNSTCPICLSDYKPKDTLRTIPECGHYFHSNCIDEWLKLNATCPICRNSH